MAFAKASDHLDGDEQGFGSILVPHPGDSALFRVKDARLAAAGIFPKDMIILERGREPASGNFVVASVGGEAFLAYAVEDPLMFARGKRKLAFEGLPPGALDEEVRIHGVGVRLLRFLTP